jgi:FPC/CPF motif-containing protein YcgG
VHLGIAVIKQLQTLIWWVRDRQKRGIALHAADFDADTLDEAAVMKNLCKERADKGEPLVTVLGKFDPDDFDTHEDAFLNLMSQTFGVLKESLHYIVHPATMPTTFGSDEEERMYQFPFEGSAFLQMDNQTVYRKQASSFSNRFTELGLD